MDNYSIPVWVWLFLTALIFYGGLVLVRAARKRYIRFGPVIYARAESPVSFWFLLGAFLVAELILLALLLGAIVSSIWGPVFQGS